MKWVKAMWLRVKAFASRLFTMRVRTRRRLYLTIVAGTLCWATVHFLWPETRKPEPVIQVPIVSYTEFMSKVTAQEIKAVVISPDVLIGVLKNGNQIAVRINSTFVNPVSELRGHGVDVTFASSIGAPTVQPNYATLVLFAIFLMWVYLYFRGIGPQGEFDLKFWKSSRDAKTLPTFADVAGMDEAKAELQRVVKFLKFPQRFTLLGGKVPKGILLIGPPGTGKTLLARAVAGEAGVPFHAMNGADFTYMFVGVGAHRVRELFAKAKAQMPCIVYIDEVDSIAAKRTAVSSGGDREYQQTTNALLSELDGFDKYPEIIFMASTNNPENLDDAFMRSGRISKKITVPPPDARGREAILKVHTRTTPLAEDVELALLALSIPGFTGADIKVLVEEAANAASEEDPPAQKVAQRHLMKVRDDMMLGGARRSLTLSEADKRRTAYHEIGHALVAMYTTGTDPVEKVSIVPRTTSLGVMLQLPESDRHHFPESVLKARLDVLMGGRAAEAVFFGGDMSAGADEDIRMATRIAMGMVCFWGMSVLGPTRLKERTGGAHLNRDGPEMYTCSQHTAALADDEIRKLCTQAFENARALLEKHRVHVVAVAEELFKRSELSGREIRAIIAATSSDDARQNNRYAQ